MSLRGRKIDLLKLLNDAQLPFSTQLPALALSSTPLSTGTSLDSAHAGSGDVSVMFDGDLTGDSAGYRITNNGGTNQTNFESLYLNKDRIND